jgi:hypothetical protein
MANSDDAPTTKRAGLGIVHVVLIVLILLNIVGDISNIVFWLTVAGAQTSLWGGLIASTLGPIDTLITGTAVLAVIIVLFAVAMSGLLQKKTWAPPLVIAISVANRIIAFVLYNINSVSILWVPWTIVLVILAYVDWRRMKA